MKTIPVEKAKLFLQHLCNLQKDVLKTLEEKEKLQTSFEVNPTIALKIMKDQQHPITSTFAVIVCNHRIFPYTYYDVLTNIFIYHYSV